MRLLASLRHLLTKLPLPYLSEEEAKRRGVCACGGKLERGETECSVCRLIFEW